MVWSKFKLRVNVCLQEPSSPYRIISALSIMTMLFGVVPANDVDYLLYGLGNRGLHPSILPPQIKKGMICISPYSVDLVQSRAALRSDWLVVIT